MHEQSAVHISYPTIRVPESQSSDVGLSHTPLRRGDTYKGVSNGGENPARQTRLAEIEFTIEDETPRRFNVCIELVENVTWPDSTDLHPAPLSFPLHTASTLPFFRTLSLILFSQIFQLPFVIPYAHEPLYTLNF